jgi:hypothetical protein
MTNNFMTHDKKRGQVMLLTTLILAGILLGATTIAGILMVYQIRQSTDIAESTKAIYAAETGLEWELYKQNKDANYVKPIMTNGTSFETSFATGTIKSVGYSGKTARALQLTY